MNLSDEIRELIKGQVIDDEPMAPHTSYRIGGPADVFVKPASLEDLQTLVPWLWKMGIPYFTLGGGTNLLVADKGIRGVVIQIGPALDWIEIEDASICAGAGTRLGALVKAAAEASLTGLECETAVPGTVGGAVVMNAGTHRGYVNEWSTEIYRMRLDGSVEWVSKEEAQFSYRTSLFQQTQDYTVLGLRGQLKHGNRTEILEMMERLFQRRRETQPTEPSAGSVFRNPPGEHAACFIQETGSKGLRVGGAMVSPMHANFIVNAGDAKAEDVRTIIRMVRERVQNQFGIILETEVKLVGDW
jgi:UDP-N-acetylmuramate dehydrogenase